MPLYEEKFLCPFAVRFSQARIRPTFQDGRIVEESKEEIQVIEWPEAAGDKGNYEALLHTPFPPIEIIRWRPKFRQEDGTTLEDEDGEDILGEPCWFTFDNRRLYCLQAAAVKAWPKRCAAIVHVMHNLPGSKCTPKKFKTTDLGNSVRISRRFDVVPIATWSWGEATQSMAEARQEAVEEMQKLIKEDADKEDWRLLKEVPEGLQAALPPLESPVGYVRNSSIAWATGAARQGAQETAERTASAGTQPKEPRQRAAKGKDLGARQSGSNADPKVAAARMAAAAAAAAAASSRKPVAYPKAGWPPTTPAEVAAARAAAALAAAAAMGRAGPHLGLCGLPPAFDPALLSLLAMHSSGLPGASLSQMKAAAAAKANLELSLLLPTGAAAVPQQEPVLGSIMSSGRSLPGLDLPPLALGALLSSTTSAGTPKAGSSNPTSPLSASDQLALGSIMQASSLCGSSSLGALSGPTGASEDSSVSTAVPAEAEECSFGDEPPRISSKTSSAPKQGLGLGIFAAATEEEQCQEEEGCSQQ